VCGRLLLKHPVGNFVSGGGKVREKRGGKSKTQRFGGARKTNIEMGHMYGKEERKRKTLVNKQYKDRKLKG
jgi:hypothetical protein